MSMQLSIKDIRVTRIEYALGPDGRDPSSLEGSEEAQVKFNFRTQEVPHEDNEFLLKVTQMVDIKGASNFPFTITAEIGGIFGFNQKPPSEALRPLKHINCNAILFPYLREVVSEISRRGGLTPIFLPPLNFVKMYQEGVFNEEQDREDVEG